MITSNKTYNPRDLESWVADAEDPGQFEEAIRKIFTEEDPVTFQEFFCQVPGPKGMVPYKAYEYQQAISRDPSTQILINKARQIGMSVSTVLDHLHRGIFNPAYRCSFISAKKETADELISKLRDIIYAMPDEWQIPVTHDAGGYIQIGNGKEGRGGAQFRAFAAKENAVRSFTGDLVCDEASSIPSFDLVLRGALATTVRSGYRVRILSTPRGNLNLFGEMVTAARALKKGSATKVQEMLARDWSYYEIPWTECGHHINGQWVPDLQESRIRALCINQEMFDQEFCCLPNTLIDTDTIRKPITNITTKDNVITHLGNYYKVKELMQRSYSGLITKVFTQHNNMPLELTEGHRVYAIRVPECKFDKRNCRCTHKCSVECSTKPITYNKPEWIPINKLTKWDILIHPIKQFANNYQSTLSMLEYLSIPYEFHQCNIHNQIRVPWTREENKGFKRKTCPSSAINYQLSIDKLLPILGWYVAEGCSSSDSRCINFALSSNEQIEATFILRSLQELFGRNVGKIINRQPQQNSYSVYYSGRLVTNFFENLCGKGSHNKKIPFFIFNLSQSQKETFIKTLWQGDGHCDEEKGSFVTVSQQLAFDLYDLLLSMGYVVGINTYEHPPKYSRFDYKDKHYSIVIHGETYVRFCHNIMKRDLKVTERINYHGWIDNNYLYMPIRKIESYHYDGLVYNLAIDPDQSYTANGYIVHNCCKIVDESTAMLSYELLTRSTSNELAQFSIYNNVDQHNGSTYFIGIDPASQINEAGFVISEKTRDNHWNIRFVHAQPMANNILTDYTVNWYKHVRPLKIYVDKNNIGLPFCQDLAKQIGSWIVVDTPMSQQSKEWLVYNMVGLFESGKLTIPNNEKLFQQLHALEQDNSVLKGVKTFTGKVKSDQDDLVWATALSLAHNYLNPPNPSPQLIQPFKSFGKRRGTYKRGGYGREQL